MVAQGKFSVVKGEINESSSTALQAVKRLARFLHKKSDRAAVLDEVLRLNCVLVYP